MRRPRRMAGPSQSSRDDYAANQYESELITSPRARVPKDHQICIAIELLMNETCPSAKQTLAPPGWLLLELVMLEWSADTTLQVLQPNRQARHWYCGELGGTIVLNIDMASAPQAQNSPSSVWRPAPDVAVANAALH